MGSVTNQVIDHSGVPEPGLTAATVVLKTTFEPIPGLNASSDTTFTALSRVMVTGGAAPVDPANGESPPFVTPKV